MKINKLKLLAVKLFLTILVITTAFFIPAIDTNAITILNVNFQTMNFGNPVSHTGTDLAAEAVYKYNNVITVNGIQVDATITIVTKNNATLRAFDNDPGGQDTAQFEPIINTGSGGGYFDFKFDFFDHSTGNPVLIKNFYLTGIDIDGNTEFQEIAGYASYTVHHPNGLTITNNYNSTGYTRFDAVTSDLNGVSFDDTAAYIANYTTAISSMHIILGNKTQITQAGVRLFSLNFGAPGGVFTSPTDNVNNPNVPTVSVNVNDGDGYLNASDTITSVPINGTATAAPGLSVVGQTVTISITDGTNTVYGTAIVQANGSYNTNMDLSSLNPGTLTATANVSDNLGNPAVPATDTTIKQTMVVVTYNPEGGTVNPTSQNKLYGSTYGKNQTGAAEVMPIPTKTGYTFGGWYDSQTSGNGSGNNVLDTTTVTNLAAHTLYASWTANTTAVTYNPEGGSVTPTSQNKLYGSTYGKNQLGAADVMPTPAKSGYTFGGWYDAEASGNGSGNRILDTTTVTNPAAHTLYANWTVNTIAVTYNPEGGSVTPTNQNKLFGSTYGKDQTGAADVMPTPAKAGYTFGGWYDSQTSGNGSGNKIVDTTTVTNPAAHTLYANWTANTIAVTYNPEGGSVIPTSQDKLFGSSYGKDQTGAADLMPAPAKAGYTFNGWYDAETSGNKVLDTTTVTNPAAHILYANWAANTIIVTYNPEGGSVTPTSQNKLFASTYGKDQTGAADVMPTPTKTGYTFGGWYDAEISGNKVLDITTVTKPSAHSLYASWTPIPYTVTFESNGGPSIKSQTVNYGAEAQQPSEPAKSRYAFGGWYKDSSLNIAYDFQSLITCDIMLYAKWTPTTGTIEEFIYNDANGNGVKENGEVGLSDVKVDVTDSANVVHHLVTTNGSISLVVPLGSTHIKVTAPGGFRLTTVGSDDQTVTITGDNTTSASDVGYDGFIEIVGHVKDGTTGNPIRGAAVTIYDLFNNKIKINNSDQTIETDSDGYYAITPGIAVDVYKIVISDPQYNGSNQIIDLSTLPMKNNKITVDATMVKFSINLKANPTSIIGNGKDTSTLTTQIKDLNGKPLKDLNGKPLNIKVTFNAPAGTFPGGGHSGSADTDDNGKASIVYTSEDISGVLSKQIPVTATVDDPVRGLSATDQIVVTFEPGSIQGIVTDNDTKQPVAGAKVTVDREENGVKVFYAEQITEADGKYKIAVPKGGVPYNVIITKPVTIGATTQNMDFKQSANPGNITGAGNEVYDADNVATGIIVLDKGAGSQAAIDQDVYNKISLSVDNKDTGSEMQGLNASINSSGQFSVSGLNQNTNYTLNIEMEVASAQNGQPAKKIVVGHVDVTLTNGEMKISKVLIDPYGTITDANTHNPIIGADVKLYYANTANNAAAKVDHDTLVSLPELDSFQNKNLNPQSSDANGKYGYMVYPNTDYYIVADRAGYYEFTSPTISVGTKIVKYDFAMTPMPAAPAVNTPPTVGNYSATTEFNTQASGKVVGTDVDKDTLSYYLSGNPSHGTVTVNIDGSWKYAPSTGYYGNDSFKIKVSDARGGTADSIVTILVNPKPNTPPAVPDYKLGTGYTTPISGKVVGNDPDNDMLTYSKDSDPAHGTLAAIGDGNWTYVPAAGYSGTDTFRIIVNDGRGGTAISTITITVGDKPNTPPTVGDSSVSTEYNTPASGRVSATDPDGDSLTYSKASDPSHGTVIVNPDGTWNYTPADGFWGNDSFTVQISDGKGGTVVATVTVNVGKPNTPPTVGNYSDTVSENKPASGKVSANDSDNDKLTYEKESNPSNGTVTVNPDGTWKYVPKSGFVGTDTFKIKVNDGKSESVANVSVTVEGTKKASAIPGNPKDKTNTSTINGKDVYEVAADISKYGWVKSDYVIVAVGDAYADALAAVPLAKKYNAPILLTLSDKLPKYTLDELKRLGSKHVFIMGGATAVSSKVQKDIEKLLKVKAVRIGGNDHYTTSVKIADQIKYYNDIIIVYGQKYTYGKTYSDSIPVAPIAAAQGTPILYIDYDQGAKEISGFLKKVKVNNIYLLNGGKPIDNQMISLIKKLTNKIPIAITANDIFETNINIIRNLDSSNKFDYKNILIIGGYNKDNMKSMGNALTGAALAAKLNAVVILSDNKISGDTERYLKEKLSGDTRFIQIGGENLVPSSFIKKINNK